MPCSVGILQAEGLKKAAEAAFEECSDIARHEVTSVSSAQNAVA